MSNVDIYAILASKPHNKHQLDRYFKFILACSQANSLKTKEELGYTEKHHICPKAKDLFPEYASFKYFPWNKVILTGRQHFIAHWMLWKAYGGSQTNAFWFLSQFESFNAKTYNLVREDVKKKQTGRFVSQETREKQSKSLSGLKRTPEQNAALSQRLKGKKQNPELIAKRVAKNTGKKRSKESLEKMSKAQKGRIITEETKQKLSELAKGRSASEKTKQKMKETKRCKTIYKFINKLSGECFIGMRYEFEEKFGFKISRLFSKNARSSINNWSVDWKYQVTS